jgi:hypothetical protein
MGEEGVHLSSVPLNDVKRYNVKALLVFRLLGVQYENPELDIRYLILDFRFVHPSLPFQRADLSIR